MSNRPTGAKQLADARELPPPAATSNRRKKAKVPEEDSDSEFEDPERPARKRPALSQEPQPRVTRAATKKADQQPASLPAPDASRRGDSAVDATMQDHGYVPAATTAYSMPGLAQGRAADLGQVYHGYQPFANSESAYRQVPPVENPYQQVDQVESPYQLAPRPNNPYQQSPYQQVPRPGSSFQSPVRQGLQGNSPYQQAPPLNNPYQQSPRPDNLYQQVPQLNPPYQQVPQLGSPFRSPIRRGPQVNSPYQNVPHVDCGTVSSLSDGPSPQIGQDIEGSVQPSSSLTGSSQLYAARAEMRAFLREGSILPSVGIPSSNQPPPRFTLGDRINTSPTARPIPPMQLNLPRPPVLQSAQYPGSSAGSMRTQASPTRPMQTGSHIPSFGQMQAPPPFFGLPSSSNVSQRSRTPSFGTMRAQGSPVRLRMNRGPNTGFMQPSSHGQGQLSSARSMLNQGPTNEPMQSPYLRQDQALSTSVHHTASNEQLQQSSSGLSRATSAGPSQLASGGQIQFHDSRNLSAAQFAPLQPSTLRQPQDLLSVSNLPVSVGPSQLFPNGQTSLPSGRAGPASNAPFQPSLLGLHEMTNIDQMASPGSHNMATPEPIQTPPEQIRPSTPAPDEQPSSLQGDALQGQSNMPSIQDMVATPDAQPEPTSQLDVSVMGPAVGDEIPSETGEGSSLWQQLEADARFLFENDFDENFIVIPESQQKEDGGQGVENEGLDNAPPSNDPELSDFSAAQQPTGQYDQTQTGREHIWVNQTGYTLMRKVINDNGEALLPASKFARIITGDDLGKIATKMYALATDFQNGLILDRFSRFCGSFSTMKLVTLAHLNVLPSWWLMRTIAKDSLAKAGYVVDDTLAVRFFDLAHGMSTDFLASAQSVTAGGAGYVGLAAAMAAAYPPTGGA